ncbi:MAG: hypothetical protein E7672_01345 [Ruminococcaceae bacterium]|nr:hypothetical protein [Oscillospiraceae bacterium]
MRENTHNTKPIAECISCGGELYDGEIAYLTHLGYFCPECIRESYTVCRKDSISASALEKEVSTIFGIRSDNIRIKREASKG